MVTSARLAIGLAIGLASLTLGGTDAAARSQGRAPSAHHRATAFVAQRPVLPVQRPVYFVRRPVYYLPPPVYYAPPPLRYAPPPEPYPTSPAAIALPAPAAALPPLPLPPPSENGMVRSGVRVIYGY